METTKQKIQERQIRDLQESVRLLKKKMYLLEQTVALNDNSVAMLKAMKK